MLVRPTKYSALLSKIHSYRQFFRRFCPLGYYCFRIYKHARN